MKTPTPAQRLVLRSLARDGAYLDYDLHTRTVWDHGSARVPAVTFNALLDRGWIEQDGYGPFAMLRYVLTDAGRAAYPRVPVAVAWRHREGR